MGKFIDLTGLKFNSLTVIKHIEYEKWECKCNCGKVSTVRSGHLKNGHTKSCGCLMKGVNIKHGQTKLGKVSVEYTAWLNMISRCSGNNKNPNNKIYIERGITVCEKWLHSFECFFEDMGIRPSKKHSLERENNNLGYCKDNCKWGTNEEQVRNKSNNHWLEYDGRRMILSDWAKEFNVTKSTLKGHLYRGNTFEYIFEYYSNKNRHPAYT